MPFNEEREMTISSTLEIKILIKRNDLFPILGKKISFDNLDLIAVNFKLDTLPVETGKN